MKPNTNDPRRWVVTYHSNSSSPRAQRWYSIATAVELDGRLWLLIGRHELKGVNPRRRADATRAARTLARHTGRPFAPGLWRGTYGAPLKREA